MTRETFEKILPALSKTGLAYLQGWGEPFLHPDIFTFISLAKQTGCKVGMTTNALALDDDTIQQLVETGVDIISFSLAGASGKNDSIRNGTKQEKVVDVIRRLNQIKRDAGASLPSIHIAYMLLRSGLDEIEQLPSFFSGQDIDQVVITTLPYAPSPPLENERLHNLPRQEHAHLNTHLQAVTDNAKQLGVPLYYYLNDPENDGGSCTENIERALFISAAGEVSPCVFSCIPIQEDSYELKAGKQIYKKLVFGNINHQSFQKIWNQKAYRNFRKSFLSGRLSQQCIHCPKRMEVLYAGST